MKVYVNRVCIQFSILINVLFGGKLNQTVSATQHQRRRDGKANVASIIDTIFFWDTEHCINAWIKWQIIHSAINNKKVYKDED
mgnify:CR=1 FL=1